MNTRNLLPVMVLLTLTAPPAGAAGPAASGDKTDPRPAQVAAAASPSTGRRVAARQSPAEGRNRRRGRAGGRADGVAADRVELDAEDVAAAGAYLRCRADGGQPAPALRDAWERFFPACDGAVRRFAGSFRSRGVDADDCAQEVWVDLLKKLPAFELDGSRGRFTSWLYAIVRTKAADQVRRRARRPAEALTPAVANALTSGGADPGRRAEAADDAEAVRRALAVLARRSSERAYRVLHLRQIEGRDVRDVADALGIPPRQVWVTEHRMKRKLRDLLAAAR